MSQLATQRPLVLIVEDDFLIRTATAEAIRDAGFEVLQAADADAAIVILEGRSDIQVVLRMFTCRVYGWREAGPRDQKPLAARPCHCHLGSPSGNARFAGRYLTFSQAIQPGAYCVDASITHWLVRGSPDVGTPST